MRLYSPNPYIYCIPQLISRIKDFLTCHVICTRPKMSCSDPRTPYSCKKYQSLSTPLSVLFSWVNKAFTNKQIIFDNKSINLEPNTFLVSCHNPKNVATFRCFRLIICSSCLSSSLKRWSSSPPNICIFFATTIFSL